MPRSCVPVGSEKDLTLWNDPIRCEEHNILAMGSRRVSPLLHRLHLRCFNAFTAQAVVGDRLACGVEREGRADSAITCDCGVMSSNFTTAYVQIRSVFLVP